MGTNKNNIWFDGFFSPFSADRPNRVVATNAQGFSQASDVTNTQLQASVIASVPTDFNSTVFVETDGDDSLGMIGKPNKPFLTINAALDALPSTGGVIRIGIGDFNSPSESKIKDNTIFIGSGKPVPNWTLTHNSIGSVVKTVYTSPTKLTGGTVLKGTFVNKLHNNVSIRDIGVDTGSEWCANFNGGNPQNALLLGQTTGALQTSSPQLYGLSAINVSAICQSASAPVHAMLFENVYAFHGENLSTYYGLHGVVLKGIGGEIKGVDAHGHGSNGLILKGNDYAYNIGVNISNIYITSIGSFDGGGIRLTGENSTLLYPKISNFTIENTTFGIVSEGAVDGLNIYGGSIYNVSGIGINIPTECMNFKVVGIEQKLGTYGVIIVGSATANSTGLIANVTASSNTNKGFDLSSSGAAITAVNLSSLNNTGAGFQISGNVYGNNNINTASGADVGAFLSLTYAKADNLIPDGTTRTKTIGSTIKEFDKVYAGNFLSISNAFYGTTVLSSFIDTYQGGRPICRLHGTTGNLTLQNGGTFTDDTVNRLQVAGSIISQFGTKASDPVAADIPAGYTKIYKNTTSGVLKLWANDGGTLKSVTLT